MITLVRTLLPMSVENLLEIPNTNRRALKYAPVTKHAHTYTHI